MKRYFSAWALLGAICLVVTGCATAPETGTAKRQLDDDAIAALKSAELADASLSKFLANSAGYVVFPTVSKGAVGIGGSYGRGIVYNGNDQMIGYADITQATIGLQAGGEEFSEILVLESRADMDRFKAGKTALAGNLSAVALKTGAADSARYTDGVAVFVQPIGGLMVEASVGGQQFTYQSK